MRPVRWGILSTAAIGQLVVDACRPSLIVDFVGVASRELHKAQDWASAHGIERSYGSYDELLADPEIDAVYVSLPNSLHLEWAMRALLRGKHVLCEKPLSRDPQAVGQVFALAEREGKILAEAFMYRYHAQTYEARRLLAAGAIGTLRHVRATLTYPMRDPKTDVRTSLALDGGALMDVGCYCVSAFRLFAGEPQITDGYAIQRSSGVDVRFLGTLGSLDGVTGQFDCGMDLPRRDVLELVGDEGTLLIPDPWHCRGVTMVLTSKHGLRELSVDGCDAYQAECEAISVAIRGGQTLEFGRDDAVAQAGALAALHNAATRMDPAEGRK